MKKKSDTTKKKYFRKYILCSWIVLFLFCIVLVFFLAAVVGFRFSKEIFSSHPEEVRSKDYRFYKFNPKTNESSFGFMKLTREVKKDGYFTYQDSSGSYVVLSPFGSRSSEYQCTGACYCNNKYRRVSSLTLIRPLFHLVAAVSSVVAVKLAKDQFDEQCLNNIASDSCDQDRIHSDVEGCVLAAASASKKQFEVISVPSGRGTKKLKVSKFGKYLCRGICTEMPIEKYFAHHVAVGNIDEVDMKIISENFVDIKGRSERFGCRKLQLDKIVTYPEEYALPKTQKEYNGQMRVVTSHFLMYDLQNFCLERSWKDIAMVNRIGTDIETRIPMCSSLNEERKAYYVECVPNGIRLTEPKFVD